MEAVQAAAPVAGLEEDRVLELSEALARHSLVYAGSTELGSRTRMLETIRVFVAERLAAGPTPPKSDGGTPASTGSSACRLSIAERLEKIVVGSKLFARHFEMGSGQIQNLVERVIDSRR